MQGDLFHLPVNSSVKSFSEPRTESFLESYRITLRLDQLVMMLILTLVIFAVVFSMGVEKGKRSMPVYPSLSAKMAASSAKVQKAPAPAPLTVAATPVSQTPLLPQTIEIKEDTGAKPESLVVTEITAAEPETPVLARPTGKYTIQLVTYKSEEQAQKQIDKLSSKGYHGFTIPSGSYHQVCVNAFETRQTAQALLKTLQSEKLAPSDAYVRAMPH